MKLSHKVSIVSTVSNVSGVLSKTKLVNIQSNHFINHFTHLTHNTHLKRTGFTLAEVLITLGIIGVVAAMTMPVLIQNHRKHVVETKLKKFYSVMNQAIALSEVHNDNKMSWSANNSDEFWIKYLSKYLNYVKSENLIKDGDIPKKCVYLSDGSVFTIQLIGSNMFQTTFYFNEKDVENDIGSPGKDKFFFFYAPNSNEFPYLKNKGLEPYVANWDGNENSLYSDPVFGCNSNARKIFCAALIQHNGWKIPDNYPIRF